MYRVKQKMSASFTPNLHSLGSYISYRKHQTLLKALQGEVDTKGITEILSTVGGMGKKTLKVQ